MEVNHTFSQSEGDAAIATILFWLHKASNRKINIRLKNSHYNDERVRKASSRCTADRSDAKFRVSEFRTLPINFTVLCMYPALALAYADLAHSWDYKKKHH